MSDFFEPPPRRQPEPEPEPPEWAGPPLGSKPARVPVEQVVARTGEVAIYLASLAAFPTGFAFDLFVVADDPETELDPIGFDYREEAERTGEIPAGQLRLGFLFADGAKATNTSGAGGWYGQPQPPPASPIMIGASGGRGGLGRWKLSPRVWPLPPPGRLEFVCEWPQAKVPLTRFELDAAPLLDAASRSAEVSSSGAE